jgi:hypothetical protein
MGYQFLEETSAEKIKFLEKQMEVSKCDIVELSAEHVS